MKVLERIVELDAFYMGKYELGGRFFELFLNKNKELFQTWKADKLSNIDAIT